jgi:hypothetical protein
VVSTFQRHPSFWSSPPPCDPPAKLSLPLHPSPLSIGLIPRSPLSRKALGSLDLQGLPTLLIHPVSIAILPVTVSPPSAPAVRSPEQTAAASEPRPQRRLPGPLLTQGGRAGAAEPWRPMKSTRRVRAERPRHGRRAVNKAGGWARACALCSWPDRVVIVAARVAGAYRVPATGKRRRNGKMSCFPCFGKKDEQADPSGPSEQGPASNMTPPQPVHAPPAANAATPSNDAKQPPGGGGERASASASIFLLLFLAPSKSFFLLRKGTSKCLQL